MQKIIHFIKKNRLLIVILLVGVFLRLYKPAQLFLYNHDHDLAGWIIKDVVVNRHLRLIGQETSTHGIFIGPLFYYALIPFYLAFGMDPIGGVAMITLLGVFSLVSVYFVFSEVFGKKVALIGTFLYAVSFYTVFNDREVVPTMPVIAWTVWFLYCLDKILKGKQEIAFIILGILTGLIWHLNFALVLLLPLIVVTLVLSKKKLNLLRLRNGVVSFVITSIPLLLFEIRHGFLQTKALLTSLTTHQSAIISGYDKFQRVILLLSKNIGGFVWGSPPGVKHQIILYVFVLIFIFLVYKKVIKKNVAIILTLWVLIFIAFFASYSKILSEYYLNGTMIVWIIIASLFFSYLLKQKKYFSWGVVAIAIFLGINLYRFFSININRSGYIERKAIVAEIKRDAEIREYPCVSVSYITNPGYDLGYRYLFFQDGMHVNRPESGSPVYTIVFPLNDELFPTHKTFGHIGLIYPDYKQYLKDSIIESCSGENSNLTDPMFGYTE